MGRGEIWVVGSAHNVTWTSTGTIANGKVEYSTNNGIYYWTAPTTNPQHFTAGRSDSSDGIGGPQDRLGSCCTHKDGELSRFPGKPR